MKALCRVFEDLGIGKIPCFILSIANNIDEAVVLSSGRHSINHCQIDGFKDIVDLVLGHVSTV